MIYTDAFYEAIIKKINSTKLTQKAKDEKIRYVKSIQALDKEGVAAHAAFIKKTRYDTNKATLYYPTEIYTTEGMERTAFNEIRYKAVPMHIEYWAPKKSENTDDPMMNFFTLEQYLEKEINDFGEAWELAQQNQKELDFIGTQMSGGCYEVCSRGIKEWKSMILELKPGVFDDPINEQKAIFALIEHYQNAYVTELGGMNGELETLPANLATYEPFMAWLMSQKFTVNGKQPKEVKAAIEKELIETLGWTSVKEVDLSKIQPQIVKMEVEKENLAPPAQTQETPLQKEKALADEKLKEILPNYKDEKYQQMLKKLYELNITARKKAPLEALAMAIDNIERNIVADQEAAKEAPALMEVEVFWANKGSKVLDATSDPSLLKLPVMDQVADRSGFGQQSCGYHATKNALAIVYCLSKKEQPGMWVNDQGYFNNIFAKLKTYTAESGDAKDINVVQVKQFIKDVQAKKFKDPVIDKVSGALVANNKPKLPAISVAGFAVEGSKFGYASSGSSNLEDAANLYYIATHAKKELQHTFILGNSNVEGHWITLTLNQDEAGERTWIGTNSDANQSADLVTVKKGLETLMMHPEAYINDTYAIAVGDNLSTRANNISKDNLSISAQNSDLLLKTEKENLLDIQNALEFMKRCGWLNGDKRQEHQKEIADIQYLVMFYAEHDPANKEWKSLKEKVEPLVKSVEQSIKNRDVEQAKQKEELAKQKEEAARKAKEEAQAKLQTVAQELIDSARAVTSAKSEVKDAKKSDDPSQLSKSISALAEAQETKKQLKEAEDKLKREMEEAKRKENQAKREEKQQHEKLEKLQKEAKKREEKEQKKESQSRLEGGKSLKDLISERRKEEAKQQKAQEKAQEKELKKSAKLVDLSKDDAKTVKQETVPASKEDKAEEARLQADMNKKQGQPSKWQQQRELREQKERQEREEKAEKARVAQLAEREKRAQAEKERRAKIEQKRAEDAQKEQLAKEAKAKADKERLDAMKAHKDKVAQEKAEKANKEKELSAKKEPPKAAAAKVEPPKAPVKTKPKVEEAPPPVQQQSQEVVQDKRTSAVIVSQKQPVNEAENKGHDNISKPKLVVGGDSNLRALSNMLKMIDIQKRYDAGGANKSFVSRHLKFQSGDRPKQIKALQDEINRAVKALELMQQPDFPLSPQTKQERLRTMFSDLEKTINKIDGELKKSGTSRMEGVINHLNEEVALMRKAMHVEQPKHRM